MKKLCGITVAMVSPMHADGSVDLAGVAAGTGDVRQVDVAALQRILKQTVLKLCKEGTE